MGDMSTQPDEEEQRRRASVRYFSARNEWNDAERERLAGEDSRWPLPDGFCWGVSPQYKHNSRAWAYPVVLRGSEIAIAIDASGVVYTIGGAKLVGALRAALARWDADTAYRVACPTPCLPT